MTKKRLSPKQFQAIDLLASGKTQASVCELLDVDRVTIHRWKKSELFSGELDDRITQASKQALTELRALKLEAVATWRTLMQDPETPANIRASIAGDILKIAEPALETSTDKGLSEELLVDIRQRVYGIYD